jgi:hypothetical protein
MTSVYTKLAADGSDLPADSTEKHLAVRVDHSMLKSPIVVSAYRSIERVSFDELPKYAATVQTYNWNWRGGTPEEWFFVPDRTKYPALDKNFFPDTDECEWTWTSLVDVESPSDGAWVVNLGDGDVDRNYQSHRGQVRLVRAGQ